MKKGFTLLELLLVLALVGLITGVIMPRLGGSLSGVKLRSATNSVAAMMRYARSQAAAEQLPHQVVFDSGSGNVVLRTAEDAGGGAGSSLKVYELPAEVEIAGIKSGARAVFGEGKNGFIFYPGGSCSGGEVLLAVGSRSYLIRLDRITGLVEVD